VLAEHDAEVTPVAWPMDDHAVERRLPCALREDQLRRVV
jgi:hypothetical protein